MASAAAERGLKVHLYGSGYLDYRGDLSEHMGTYVRSL